VKLFWIIVAAIMAMLAVALLVKQDYDKAFISAALGAVAWFLSYRAQLRASVKASDEEEESEDYFEADEDEST